MSRIFAWHFLPSNGKLAKGDGTLVKAGETYEVDKSKLELCRFGLHASKRAIDALHYAPGPIICRVESFGKVLKQQDKLCSSKRKVLWMADATKILHLFACEVAEHALLAERKSRREPDKRLFDAILTKRNWLEEKASDEELDEAEKAAWSATRSAAEKAAWNAAEKAAWSAAWSAAEEAAWSAAEKAARSAAWSAARSAAEEAAEEAWSAARSAAWSAARSAAWSAAEKAARSAAWSAARSAAEEAAWSAARSAAEEAARSEQNKLLTRMLMELKPK